MTEDPTDHSPPAIITREHLHALGYDDRAIATSIRRTDLVRLRKGRYAYTNTVQGLGRAERHLVDIRAALARVEPPIVVSRESAVIAFGGSVLRHPDRVTMTRQRRCYTKYPGVLLLDATLPSQHTTEWLGLPITTPARSVVDLARRGDFVATLVAADSMLRLQRYRSDDVQRVLRDCRGWPGVRRGATALSYADARAETALESISRAGMILQGVPLPELQAWVRGADGQWYRTDFLWREQRLIGESDGRLKYLDPEDPEALLREKRRQEALENGHYRFVRWDYSDALYRPAVMAARILAKLRASLA